MNELQQLFTLLRKILFFVLNYCKKNPEFLIFGLFIIANLLFDTYKLYLGVIVIFYIGSLFFFKNSSKATWFTFFCTFLFHKTKNFTQYFGDPAYYFELINESPNITYFISFSDILLALVLYVVFLRNRKDFFSKNKVKFVDLIMLLLILLSVASSTLSLMPNVSWFWTAQLVKYVMLFYLARLLALKYPGLTSLTIKIFLLFCLLNAGLAILQKYSGGPLGLRIENAYTLYGKFADESKSLYRPGGMYWDANLTATFFSMAIPFLLVFAFSKVPEKIKKIAFACLVVVSVGLILTASRAVWIITFLSSALLYFSLIKKRLLKPFTLSKKVLVSVAVLAAFFVFPILVNRLASLATTISDERGGLQYRLSHIKMSSELMISRPFGVGLNVFQYAILTTFDTLTYFGDSTAAHNLLAEVGAGFGVAGLVFFIILVISIGSSLKDSIGRDPNLGLNPYYIRLGLSFSVINYFLCAQFYPLLFSPVVTGVTLIFLGFIYAQKDNQKA